MRELGEVHEKCRYDYYEIRKKGGICWVNVPSNSDIERKLELGKMYDLRIVLKSDENLEYEPINVGNCVAYGAYYFDFRHGTVVFPIIKKKYYL